MRCQPLTEAACTADEDDLDDMKFAVSIENKIRGDRAKWNDVGIVPGGGAKLSNVCMHELMNCIKDKMKNNDRISSVVHKLHAEKSSIGSVAGLSLIHI